MAKFLLKLLTLHCCTFGLNDAFFPATSALTVVVDTPYPIPPLLTFIETILPCALSSGINSAPVPTPETTIFGGVL